MSNYPEIASATYQEIEGTKYFVRKFGLGSQVLEEELTPIPISKIIKTMKDDGTEDEAKRRIIPLTESSKE